MAQNPYPYKRMGYNEMMDSFNGTINMGGGRPQGASPAVAAIAGGYQSAYDEAKTANESRYQDIKGGYQGVYDRTMAGLDERSGQARQDITDDYRKTGAATQQRMTGRGLYNTSAATSMAASNERERSAALNRQGDSDLDRRIGYDVGLTGDKLSFMERREDEYPDQQMLVGLADAIGRAGPQGLSPDIMQLYQSLAGGGGGRAGETREQAYARTNAAAGGTPARGAAPTPQAYDQRHLPKKPTGPSIYNPGNSGPRY